MHHGLGSGLIDGDLISELKPETIDKINRRLMVSMKSGDTSDMACSGAVPVVEGLTAEARASSESASSLAAGKTCCQNDADVIEGTGFRREKVPPGVGNYGIGPVAWTAYDKVNMGAIAEGVKDR